MEKLVVVIMGQNCERFIDMSLESVKDADAIVYCDGGSTDDTLEFTQRWMSIGPTGIRYEIIKNKYDQEDLAMNGKQRNFYLNYLKENYPDYWCLAIDADEVVEDLDKIKEFIQSAYAGLYSVKMRHLIGDLTHEDATSQDHYCLNRLFKVKYAGEYPEVEHPVLQCIYKKDIYYGQTDCTTIWHLAYCPNMWEIKKRYDNHLAKSNMHTPEYLKQWRNAHLFGTYPKKQFNPVELPSIILKKFGVDKDELYFANRGLEVKHFIDAIHWKEFFKCKSAFEFGCGRGPRVYAMNNIGMDASGCDISEYAINNALDKKIFLGDVTDDSDGVHPGDAPWMPYFSDLIIAYDLFEHIPYEKLNDAIENISLLSEKYILVSVPFKGTPNCEADPTHIIKENRDWWVSKFTDEGLKEVEVPEHFLFREQLLIFEK